MRVSFSPRPNATYRYAVTVHAETTTTIDGRPPNHRVNDEQIEARHTVVAADRDGVVVDVVLQVPGTPDRTFEVRLDRTGSLAEVQRVERLPASLLGDLGLAEVFPAAAGAPPDRPLRPGSSWTIDQPVRLPDRAPARLTGRGRLDRLGLSHGRQLATIESRYRLPVHEQTGDTAIDGVQTTSVSATHDLSDGAVQLVRATTTGEFRLTLSPPAGVHAPPLTGQLTVEVRSETRRR